MINGLHQTRHNSSDSQKIDLFSTTAHELKTPITTLKLLIELYISRNKKGLAHVPINELKIMNQELNRLTSLVDDLLDASTLGEGKLNLRIQTLNLTALVADIVKQTRILTNDHKIEFDEDIGTDISIATDPNRLTQVLLNLITNATKYSPANTAIRISVKKYKNNVRVSVKDQGEGLSGEMQSKVFERYYQADRFSTKGIGLGLYITKEIVDKLKGKIWLKSKINKGSTFAFSLPLSSNA